MSTINGAKKPSKGRPRIDSEAVNVRFERNILTELDEWRRLQTDLPTRPEAIRRILESALKASPPEVTVEAIVSYCRNNNRGDLASYIQSMVWEIKNPSDAPLGHSFPLPPASER